MLKVAIGSDHGGYLAKSALIPFLMDKGYEIIDVGCDSLESCHYPIFAKAVGELISKKTADFGILICSSGEGVMIAANKIGGIRCGLGYNDEVSATMRKHNDANIIAFGGKYMTIEDIKRRTLLFLTTDFEGGRHQVRVDMLEK